MPVDRKHLRVIRGGKSAVPPEPPAESQLKKDLRNLYGFLRMAQEMNSLNAAPNLPWAAVKRAEMIEDDLENAMVLAESIFERLE